MRNDFYCYGHFDAQGVCKYVGKGTKKRAWNFRDRSKRWQAEFKDNPPKVVIFAEKMSQEEALEIESKTIKKLLEHGIDLINVYSQSPPNKLADPRLSKLLSEQRSGKNHYSWGKPRPRWIIERLQEGKRLKAPRPRLGAKLTPENKKKLHDAAHSPEARAKIAASKKGKKLAPEHVAKIVEKLEGRVVSDETKKKISESNKGKTSQLKGRTMPQAWREAISKATIGRRPLTPDEQARRLATWKARGGTTKKARAVLCVEENKVYRCAKDAATAVGGSDKHIQACCVGRRKTHKGMSWKYANV